MSPQKVTGAADPGVSAGQVKQMAKDQQLLLLDGVPMISRKLDYLTDRLYQSPYDQNPFSTSARPGRRHRHPIRQL